MKKYLGILLSFGLLLICLLSACDLENSFYVITVNKVGVGTVSRSPDLLAYSEGEIVALTASPGAGWEFDHWEGDISGKNASTSIVMDSNKSVTAVFAEQTASEYSLTVSIQGSGTVSRNPSQSTYLENTQVTLTANPSAGWEFDHWEGDLTGTNATSSIAMSSNKSVTAVFAEQTASEYSLTVSIQGSGTVSRNPSQSTYPENTQVTLTANPSAGWEFDHWEGDLAGTNATASLTMSSNKTVTAIFREQNASEYSLIVSIQGSGTVSRNPNNSSYPESTQVTLTANPSAGWEFDHWEGDLTGSNATVTITMSTNKSVTAVFIEAVASHRIDGFRFPFSEGDFWEYEWHHTVYRDYNTTPSEFTTGTYVLYLGESRYISGITAYELKSHIISGDDTFIPRWNYLAMADGIIYGSENGINLTVLFNAVTGAWPGSGMFDPMPSDVLFVADDPGPQEEIISVGQSTNTSRCEYFEGIGTICGSNADTNYYEYEYYLRDVGPYGYFYHYDVADYYYQYSERNEIELLRSSFLGHTWSPPTIETIDFELDGEGFRQVYTNDSSWYDSLWYQNLTYQDDASTFTHETEIEVKKNSGASTSPFGLIMHYQDVENFYCFLITVDGQYNLYLRRSSGYSSILGDWINSSAINTGYGELNRLKMVMSRQWIFPSSPPRYSHKIELYINGMQVEDGLGFFPQGEIFVNPLLNGYTGYIAFAGNESQESFPDIPMDVRFKQFLPESDP